MMEVNVNVTALANPEEECVDFHHLSVPTGQLYIPGNDPCIICLCSQGKPLWCQAVRCAASKDCLFYTTGRSCCEFVCMDRAVEAFSGFFLLSLILLAVLIYRLQKRKKTVSTGTSIQMEDAELSLISPTNNSNKLTKI